MYATDIVFPCQECNKEFRLFSEDGKLIVDNYCPHCGKLNTIKLRAEKNSNSNIPMALKQEEAEALVAAQMIATEEQTDRVSTFIRNITPAKKLKLPVVSVIMQKRGDYLRKYGWAKIDSGILEIIELSEDYGDAFADKLMTMASADPKKMPNPSTLKFLGMTVRIRPDLPPGTVQIIAVDTKTKVTIRGLT
jgi:hypothetical protein